MTTPTGRELDVELARLMGWGEIPPRAAHVDDDGKPHFTLRGWTQPGHPPDQCPLCTNWHPNLESCGTRWGDHTLPRWSRSLDALFGAGGPEMIAHWLSRDPDSACTEYGYCAQIIRDGRCGQSDEHTNHQIYHAYVEDDHAE